MNSVGSHGSLSYHLCCEGNGSEEHLWEWRWSYGSEHVQARVEQNHVPKSKRKGKEHSPNTLIVL